MGMLSAAEPVRPNLDLGPHGPGVEALRRAQTRSGVLHPVQAFPQSVSVLSGYLADKPLSAYDSLILFGRHPMGARALVHWADSVRGNSFFFSPILEAGGAFGAGRDTLGGSGYGGLGARIYGTVGNNVVFSTRALVYSEQADEPRYTHQFLPDYGETYSVEKGLGDSLLSFRTYNRFEYYLIFDQKWWSIKAGHDRLRLGPGYFSSLMASDQAPPYYLLEGRVDFAPWLKLHDYLVKMTDTRHDILKYANIHRLEFRPHKSLSLAFQDIVIYQDRDPDPKYLLPFVPLTFAEANGGGLDNAAMGLDATWASPFGVSLWAELFMDDLLGPTSFFDPFWENRWAALAGFQWVVPKVWADADLVVEYSHVEPWTYNGRQPQTSFKHFNLPSASKLGPDSRSLDVQASLRPWKGLQWREHIQWNEKGVQPGSILSTIHVDSLHGQEKEFLGAGAESRWTVTHQLGYIYLGFLEVRATWSQHWGIGLTHRFSGDCIASW